MFPNTHNLRTATRLVHTMFYSIGWPLGKFVHSRRVSKYALYIIRACLDEFLPCTLRVDEIRSKESDVRKDVLQEVTCSYCFSARGHFVLEASFCNVM